MTEEQKRRAAEALLADAQRPAETARAKLAALTQENAQLRRELAVSEHHRAEEESRAGGLTEQLNLALAAKVEELKKYRSEFFGRLRDVLTGRPGIEVVGDRFVFQSEVLFGIGSAQLTTAGIVNMSGLATTVQTIIADFQADVGWVLRIDGHTDATQVHSTRYHSNWELSAARAITVVNFLAEHGVPPAHLAAAGFSEFQPVDPDNTPAARAKNRRIEIRLTDR